MRLAFSVYRRNLFPEMQEVRLAIFSCRINIIWYNVCIAFAKVVECDIENRRLERVIESNIA